MLVNSKESITCYCVFIVTNLYMAWYLTNVLLLNSQIHYYTRCHTQHIKPCEHLELSTHLYTSVLSLLCLIIHKISLYSFQWLKLKKVQIPHGFLKSSLLSLCTSTTTSLDFYSNDEIFDIVKCKIDVFRWMRRIPHQNRFYVQHNITEHGVAIVINFCKLYI